MSEDSGGVVEPIPLVLGLTGTRGVGKDTLARCFWVLNPKCCSFAFANTLKEDIRDFILEQFAIDVRTATGADKELIRPLLITFGMAKRVRDPLYWVKRVVADLETLHHRSAFPSTGSPFQIIPIVTDFRFSNEVSYFRERYGRAFRLVNITRSDNPLPPTDEEQKHYREVGAAADYQLAWGGEATEEARLVRAREVASAIGLI